MGKHDLQKTMYWFAGAVIAAIGTTLPGFAETAPTPQLVAQASLCRAANRSTPVFEADSTISSALRLLAPNQQITLRELPPAGSQFARITAPLNGFVQTAVLKNCGTTPPPGNTCRYLKATFPIVVRRSPKVEDAPSNAIGEIRPGERVTVILTSSGSVSSARADGYNWIEIDATRSPLFLPSGTGWVFNSRVGVNESNFGVCQ